MIFGGVVQRKEKMPWDVKLGNIKARKMRT